MDTYDHRGKRVDDYEYDPEYDDPEEPEMEADCPNCGTHTAIADGVAFFCVGCGALWERCDHILTSEEERAMMEAL